MKTYRKILTIFLTLFAITSSLAQVPGSRWQQYATPEEAGFSSKKLILAKHMVDSLDASAFMIVFDGYVVQRPPLGSTSE